METHVDAYLRVSGFIKTKSKVKNSHTDWKIIVHQLSKLCHNNKNLHLLDNEESKHSNFGKFPWFHPLPHIQPP